MANVINFRSEVEFATGDTIRVHQTVIEGAKTRTQVFEGVVIRIRGHKGLKSFTVRKITVGGVGVERIFPENAPMIVKIEVKKKGKVRRAVLSYLRKRVGKKATRIQDKFVKGDWSKAEQATETVVEKDEKEAEVMTPEQRRLIKSMAEEKAEKAAKKAEKEKKKSKKKAKIQRKEKVFVR